MAARIKPEVVGVLISLLAPGRISGRRFCFAELPTTKKNPPPRRGKGDGRWREYRHAGASESGLRVSMARLSSQTARVGR
jgi:hypothetical protein